jgi:ferrochelatase
MEHAAGMRIEFVESWHDHPLLVRAFASKLRERRAEKKSHVIFTAHSVPIRTLQDAEGAKGDAYAEQSRHTAELVAHEVGLQREEWTFAFQSQGMSGGEWMGPSVEVTLVNLADSGVRDVIIQPIGFVCDHVEVLYDIDVVFRQFAGDRGITLRRAESLNDSPEFIAALAQLARTHLQTKRPEIGAKA